MVAEGGRGCVVREPVAPRQNAHARSRRLARWALPDCVSGAFGAERSAIFDGGRAHDAASGIVAARGEALARARRFAGGHEHAGVGGKCRSGPVLSAASQKVHCRERLFVTFLN